MSKETRDYRHAERKRRQKLLYGVANIEKMFKESKTSSAFYYDQELIDVTVHQDFRDRLYINHNSKWKPFFDVIVLFMVGYSCLTTTYYIAF